MKKQSIYKCFHNRTQLLFKKNYSLQYQMKHFHSKILNMRSVWNWKAVQESTLLEQIAPRRLILICFGFGGQPVEIHDSWMSKHSNAWKETEMIKTKSSSINVKRPMQVGKIYSALKKEVEWKLWEKNKWNTPKYKSRFLYLLSVDLYASAIFFSRGYQQWSRDLRSSSDESSCDAITAYNGIVCH